MHIFDIFNAKSISKRFSSEITRNSIFRLIYGSSKKDYIFSLFEEIDQQASLADYSASNPLADYFHTETGKILGGQIELSEPPSEFEKYEALKKYDLNNYFSSFACMTGNYSKRYMISCNKMKLMISSFLASVDPDQLSKALNGTNYEDYFNRYYDLPYDPSLEMGSLENFLLEEIETAADTGALYNLELIIGEAQCLQKIGVCSGPVISYVVGLGMIFLELINGHARHNNSGKFVYLKCIVDCLHLIKDLQNDPRHTLVVLWISRIYQLLKTNERQILSYSLAQYYKNCPNETRKKNQNICRSLLNIADADNHNRIFIHLFDGEFIDNILEDLALEEVTPLSNRSYLHFVFSHPETTKEQQDEVISQLIYIEKTVVAHNLASGSLNLKLNAFGNQFYLNYLAHFLSKNGSKTLNSDELNYLWLSTVDIQHYETALQVLYTANKEDPHISNDLQTLVSERMKLANIHEQHAGQLQMFGTDSHPLQTGIRTIDEQWGKCFFAESEIHRKYGDIIYEIIKDRIALPMPFKCNHPIHFFYDLKGTAIRVDILPNKPIQCFSLGETSKVFKKVEKLIGLIEATIADTSFKSSWGKLTTTKSIERIRKQLVDQLWVNRKFSDEAKVCIYAANIFDNIPFEILDFPGHRNVDEMEIYNSNFRKFMKPKNQFDKKLVAFTDPEKSLFNSDERARSFGKPEFLAKKSGSAAFMGRMNISSRDALIGKSISDLPEEQSEINFFRTLSNSTIKSGVDCNKLEFSIHAGEFDYLHINAHAYVNQDKDSLVLRNMPTLRSGILLAGSEDFINGIYPSENIENFAILSAENVLSLNLKKVRCVFLAACSSGLVTDDMLSHEQGFKAAFQRSGADIVISTRWPIESRIAKLFSEQFYKAVFDKNMDEVSAFNHAKSSVRDFFPNPLLWGAFNINCGWHTDDIEDVNFYNIH